MTRTELIYAVIDAFRSKEHKVEIGYQYKRYGKPAGVKRRVIDSSDGKHDRNLVYLLNSFGYIGYKYYIDGVELFWSDND